MNSNKYCPHKIRHDILAELDHFESKDIDASLRGFWSKNPWDARVTHVIFKFKEDMRNHLLLCLGLWDNDKYYQVLHILIID